MICDWLLNSKLLLCGSCESFYCSAVKSGLSLRGRERDFEFSTVRIGEKEGKILCAARQKSLARDCRLLV